MKKICLIFNHFRHQDGVGRSALAVANILSRNKLAAVTLIPIYTDENSFHNLLEPQVRVKHIFGFYFHGMPHIVDRLPLGWLNKMIKPQEYDIVVGFQFGISIRCVASAKLDERIAKFAWMHGYDNGLTLRDEYERIGKVVCVSKCNAMRLRSELPTIVTDYSYNPIDEKTVQESGLQPSPVSKPINGPLLITVGRLSPEKGFGRLIKVFKKIKDEGIAFTLWIVGEGPLDSDLHKLVHDLNLENDVLFLGRQNNPHKFTAKADLFVCSSYSEGYSTVCTEAIMLGVPVLSTNVSGAEEIIEEAECGKVVGLDDESLYNGLSEVLQAPSVIDEWKKTLLTTRSRFYAGTRIQRLVNTLKLNES